MVTLGILLYDRVMVMVSEIAHPSVVVIVAAYVPGLVMTLVDSVLPSLQRI